MYTSLNITSFREPRSFPSLSPQLHAQNLLHHGHLGERVVKEGLDIFRLGVGAGGKARGFEGSVELGVEDKYSFGIIVLTNGSRNAFNELQQSKPSDHAIRRPLLRSIQHNIGRG
jgi:hypothetical protein